MSLTRFDILKNALPGLTSAELQELKGRIQLLSAGKTASAAPVSGPADAAEETLMRLADYCQRRNIEMSSYTVLRKTQVYSSFRGHALLVREFWRDVTTNKNELLACTDYSMRLLERYMTKRGWIVDARTMMRNFFRVPSIVAFEFPGYKQAGTLRLVITGAEEFNKGLVK